MHDEARKLREVLKQARDRLRPREEVAAWAGAAPEHFTRPMPAEVAAPCPKCRSQENFTVAPTI